MKKNYIYHVFRNDTYNGRTLWFTFSNRKAAENCKEYYNKLAYSQKYNIYYDICKEELFNIW